MENQKGVKDVPEVGWESGVRTMHQNYG